MADQLYARYIPPARIRDPAAEQLSKPSQGSLSSSSSPISIPHPKERPITKPDASAMYERYVPPSSKSKKQVESPAAIKSSSTVPKRNLDAIDQAEIPPTKRSKYLAKSDDAQLSILDFTPNKDNPRQEDLVDRVSTNADNGGVEDAEVDPKHKSLLSKRAKSIKKAEKIARRATAKAAEAGDLEENETEQPPEFHPLAPLPQPEPVPERSGQPTFSAQPQWLASPIRISPTATASFNELGLPEESIEALQKKGFEKAFAVQAAVLPLLLPGRRHESGDVLVSAATGSGKTLSYVLPMVADISQTTIPRLRGLIVMPTRDLVSQAREVCESCASAFSAAKRRHINIGSAAGHQTLKSEQSSLMKEELQHNPKEYVKQVDRLNNKWAPVTSRMDADFKIYSEQTVSSLPDHITVSSPKIDILICTPGRLVEHLKSTAGFTLQYLKWLVIDEADKLLDQSYQQWLENVLSDLPEDNGTQLSNDRHVTKIVLSATVDRDIGKLSELKLRRPKLVVLEDVDSDSNPSETVLSLPATLIENAIQITNDGDKPLVLLHCLRTVIEQTTNLPPSKEPHPTGSLIFTKSNEAAVRLGRLVSLLEPAFASKIGILTSTIPRSTRKATLSSFHAGKIFFLFASDLVARGLDLANLAYVVNYDMPTSLTNYIHRVGRTARAGKPGQAWTLFSKTEGRWFWNDIAKSEKVKRASKVIRSRMGPDTYSEAERDAYEAALEQLGEEAAGR